jgi:hypothetical protein
VAGVPDEGMTIDDARRYVGVVTKMRADPRFEVMMKGVMDAMDQLRVMGYGEETWRGLNRVLEADHPGMAEKAYAMKLHVDMRIKEDPHLADALKLAQKTAVDVLNGHVPPAQPAPAEPPHAPQPSRDRDPVYGTSESHRKRAPEPRYEREPEPRYEREPEQRHRSEKRDGGSRWHQTVQGDANLTDRVNVSLRELWRNGFSALQQDALLRAATIQGSPVAVAESVHSAARDLLESAHRRDYHVMRDALQPALRAADEILNGASRQRAAAASIPMAARRHATGVPAGFTVVDNTVRKSKSKHGRR